MQEISSLIDYTFEDLLQENEANLKLVLCYPNSIEPSRFKKGHKHNKKMLWFNQDDGIFCCFGKSTTFSATNDKFSPESITECFEIYKHLRFHLAILIEVLTSDLSEGIMIQAEDDLLETELHEVPISILNAVKQLNFKACGRELNEFE